MIHRARCGRYCVRAGGRGKPRPYTPYSPGYTIIELIIVIAVVAIIAVAVNTDMLDFPSVRRNYAAKKIQSDIRYTQHLAMASQTRTRVNFNEAADSYTVEGEKGPGTWLPLIDPLTRQTFTVTLNTNDYAGVQITTVTLGTGSVLIFDETGSPFTQGDFPLAEPASVTLTGGMQIQFTANTGKVEIV